MAEVPHASAAVIVTGGGSGIGRATVEALRAAGRFVMAVDRSPSVLEGGAAEHLLARVADVTDPEQVEGLFRDALQHFGAVSGLVNCAGISLVEDRKLEDMSLETFDRIHAINLRGAMLMCRSAIPLLRAVGGGGIVNISSVAGLRGGGGSAYAVSKAGLIGLTKVISQQYAAESIRCNTICPGMVDTPLLEQARQKGMLSATRPGVVPGVGHPADVAQLIVFLLSDHARNISGAAYTMDGGLTLH